MGKKSFLRRDIERNPERYIQRPPKIGMLIYGLQRDNRLLAKGARVGKKNIGRRVYPWTSSDKSYRDFVKHTLRQLGYDVY